LSNSRGFVVIVGLGVTGLSCARFFVARGISFAVTDSRAEPPGLDELEGATSVSLGELDENLLTQADEIILSPGVSVHEPVIAKQLARGASVISDIELFARYAKAPVIAITGSNGKSTVTSLVSEMAKAAGIDARVGGNLGMPALDLLTDTEPDCYVLELSSFQLQTTFCLQPKVAVLLNISPDHLDHHHSFAEYQSAKLSVLNGC